VSVTRFDLFGSKLGYGEPGTPNGKALLLKVTADLICSSVLCAANPQLSPTALDFAQTVDPARRYVREAGFLRGLELWQFSSAGPLVNARLMAKRVDLGGRRRLLDVGGSGAARARCRCHQYRASRHYDANQSQQVGIVIWLPTTGCNRCAGNSVCGPPLPTCAVHHK
jgi:hypothetical protein